MDAVAGRVEGIFLSARKGDVPHPVDSAEAVAGTGLRGNRYFREGSAPEQHLTLIEAEQLEWLRAEHAMDVGAAISGRNVLVRGVGLNDLVGKRFRVGDVECRGVMLCEPCTTFEGRTHPGLIKAFVHRAGLNAELVTSGTIAVGDEIAALD
jgi:MOSC domain-containing protein YiiM